MRFSDIKRNPSPRELRQFAGIGLGLTAAWVAWTFATRGTPSGFKLGVAVVLAAIALGGLVKPALVRPIFVGWITAVFPIGWAISNAVLAVAYFVVLTPIGLIMRMSGYDPLTRRLDRAARGSWAPHNPHGNAARYFRQF